jgi:hypothetical protein
MRDAELAYKVTAALLRGNYQPLVFNNNNRIELALKLDGRGSQLLAGSIAQFIKENPEVFAEKIEVNFKLESPLAIELMRLISDSLDENILSLENVIVWSVIYGQDYRQIDESSDQRPENSPQTAAPADVAQTA